MGERAGLRPLLLSTDDAGGGAARAAYRLFKGLRDCGTDARMLVARKASRDPLVVAPAGKLGKLLVRYGRPGIERLRGGAAVRDPHALFSPARLSGPAVRMAAAEKPDIVHLHWINAGWIRPEDVARFGRPVVWTLHDMWPFTGGCHYSDGCRRFEAVCGDCPQRRRPGPNDLSARLWRRKRRAWPDGAITVVSPSRWLADKARESSLFRDQRIEVIPNGLDLTVFQPRPKAMARAAFGLPSDRKVLLFGSAMALADPRKGFDLLEAALASLAAGQCAWRDRLVIAMLGHGGVEAARLRGFDVHHLGFLNDDVALAMAYAAADVTVLPSRQENLANLLSESLACGVPCVGFRIGGNGDLIAHRKNGYLAEPLDFNELAAGISFVLEDEDRHRALSDAARRTAIEIVDIKSVAGRYSALYEELAPRTAQTSSTSVRNE